MNESIFIKLRIPTLLGLAIIIFGLAAGVYLVLQRETKATQVSAQEVPQNIVITNLESTSATISWQTPIKTLGRVSFGKNSDSEKVALDDRDSKGPVARRLHYVNLKDLSPKTEYIFKVISGKFVSQDILKFTTASEDSSQNGYQPVIGSVVSETTPISDGVVYLSAEGMTDQSSLIASRGNFIVPLSLARSEDLSGVFRPQMGQTGKIKVVTEEGQLASATFNITKDSISIGPLKIGNNINFVSSRSTTLPAPTPQPSFIPTYDLNADKKLNASDYSIMLNNLGKNPKDKRTDLNNDGVVEQKDLKLMQDEIERVAPLDAGTKQR